MKLFGIEETARGVTLYLPSGRSVQVTLAHEYAGAQALGRQVLSALRSPAEPVASSAPKRGSRASWPGIAAEHLRQSAVEVLRPAEGESLADYLERVHGSTPEVLYRAFQRMVGK